jgi:hypothetical protein
MKSMPTAYSPGAGRADARFLRDEFQEIVRRLDKDARAVAGVGFATACSPVIEIQEDLQCLLNNCMRLAAFNVDNETDATCFMFELRIVQNPALAEGPFGFSACAFLLCFLVMLRRRRLQSELN